MSILFLSPISRAVRIVSTISTSETSHLIGTHAIDITADPIEVTMWQRGSYTTTPPASINVALNQSIRAASFEVTTTISGVWSNVTKVAAPILLTISIAGTFRGGEIFSKGASSRVEVVISLKPPLTIIEGVRKNWVKWSNIGSADFTIWKDNIAGERPLDWKGWVYEIKKLGNKVVVYGENGISLLAPSGNTYGLLSIHKIGIKGRQAVAGNSKIQFFVDRTGQLYSLGETVMKSSMFDASIYPEKLDYSEYLAGLNDLVLSWDELNNLLYICDGMSGYVYSLDSKSLGSGPVNITGIGTQDGNLYVTAANVIEIPTFELCTDIYDMGSRKNKTISSIEIGTNAAHDLWVSIDYRLDKAGTFSSLPWHRVNPSGTVTIPCFGVEFRFRLKMTTYEYFKIDYIKINGVVHNYSYLDSYARGGTL